MFGSRPENEKPKNEKLNSRFTVIGPKTQHYKPEPKTFLYKKSRIFKSSTSTKMLGKSVVHSVNAPCIVPNRTNLSPFSSSLLRLTKGPPKEIKKHS